MHVGTVSPERSNVTFICIAANLKITSLRYRKLTEISGNRIFTTQRVKILGCIS